MDNNNSVGSILGYLGNFTHYSNSEVNNTAYYNFDQISFSQIIDQININQGEDIIIKNSNINTNTIKIIKNNLNATVMGQGSIVWGIINYAYQFDGYSYLQIKNVGNVETTNEGQLISCTKLNLLAPLFAYTITCWIKLSENGSGTIISRGLDDNIQFSYGIDSDKHIYSNECNILIRSKHYLLHFQELHQD